MMKKPKSEAIANAAIALAGAIEAMQQPPTYPSIKTDLLVEAIDAIIAAVVNELIVDVRKAD